MFVCSFLYKNMKIILKQTNIHFSFSLSSLKLCYSSYWKKKFNPISKLMNTYNRQNKKDNKSVLVKTFLI